MLPSHNFILNKKIILMNLTFGSLFKQALLNSYFKELKQTIELDYSQFFLACVFEKSSNSFLLIVSLRN